jgi:rhodanese-related sulfurtransferase
MGDKPADGPINLIRYRIHPRIQRRRALAASLHIPLELGAKFTDSERAALQIISGEVAKHGACTLSKDAIAALSCTSGTVVKTALRTAKAAGLIEVRQGPRYNTITISPTWKAWLDRYSDAPPDATGGG